ncbi:MAG: hypothetical protein R6U62_05765 [Bacteroidales bacterium]
MKKINFKLFAVIILAAGVLASCGVNRMVRNYDEGVRYTPETNPLENHGGEVEANVEGVISEGYFHRNAVMELTPVLKYEDGEKELETVRLRGTNTTTQGNMVDGDSQTTFDLNNLIGFEPELMASELYIKGRVFREGREDNASELNERKVADGIIVTSQRVKDDHFVSIAPHEYEEEVIITETADIYFAYMRHNLNWRLDLNSQDEAQERIENLKEFLDRGWELKAVDIHAWASPEGEVAFNMELSEDRAATAEDYITEVFEDLEVDMPEFRVEAKGEDFDGFMTKLDASDLPDKQAIANVINTQEDPAERERKIKDMTLIYEEVEKLLEPLRRAEISVHAYEPKFSYEELSELAIEDPAELTEEELLFAATLTEDKQTRLEIYENAKELFPNSYKGFNNAAAILLEIGEVEQAAQDLEKANQLAPGNGHIQNNLGVAAAWEKDIENAESLFRSARAQGINVDYNLGVIHIQKGDYEDALSSLSEYTCTYNLALAQLMAGNESAAVNTLNCSPECADVAYLKAIIAARNNEVTNLYDNLRRAIEINSDMAECARRDREFIEFFGQSEFQEIIR